MLIFYKVRYAKRYRMVTESQKFQLITSILKFTTPTELVTETTLDQYMNPLTDNYNPLII